MEVSEEEGRELAKDLAFRVQDLITGTPGIHEEYMEITEAHLKDSTGFIT